MSGASSSDKTIAQDLEALARRAEAIVKARPAYREMVDFYLSVFRRQIEWRDRLVVHPEPLERAQVQECLGAGTPLLEQHDPGIDTDSLVQLWKEMLSLFRRGNEVLRDAVDKIEAADRRGDFAAGFWLAEQRPVGNGSTAELSGKLGVEESVLSNVAAAATFPHWQQVSQTWLPHGGMAEWKRSCCPTCGGPPALTELRTEKSPAEGISGASRRFLHCAFCGSYWVIAGLDCPACGSAKKGDAKYLFTKQEPELRIDFCKSCRHYVKTILAERVSGRLHVGLEALTTVHLDLMAQEKKLAPLEVKHGN